MISISEPLSAAKVSEYYKSEYTSTSSNYYAEGKELRGEWVGRLAETFGLADQQIREEAFDRLALGQDPRTGAQLIQHRDTIKTREGEEKAHRAGTDLVFSAPKSVSLAALVGGDSRIVDAHRAAVRAALAVGEPLIQARMGDNNRPETTGKALFALFDHDTSRPVDGYSAAQLHTHCLLVNLTEDRRGQARAIQNHELFVASKLLTAVYQNRLEIALRAMGYQIERGKNHAPEIAGFSPEYIASESKRTAEIEEELAAKGLTGAAAAELAAHSTREAKLHQTPEETKAAHAANAARFGDQPARVVAEAQERTRLAKYETMAAQHPWIRDRFTPARDKENHQAQRAVNFARLKLSERNAVFDHHEVLTEALRYARGRAGLDAITQELDRQKAEGRFIAVSHVRPHAPLWRYTTPELIADERAVIEAVRDAPLRVPINRMTEASIAGRCPDLNHQQRRMVREALGAAEPMIGLQGGAGTGKTTALSALRELAEESGWRVHGLAPSSGAAEALREAGVRDSETLSRFLVRAEDREAVPAKRLFILDEASLAATRQVRAFLQRIGPADRVIISGDVNQHDSVEAGRIFAELQQAGMRVATLSTVVRQKDEGLREVVHAMAEGRVADGVDLLGKQGRVMSIQHRGERFAAVAADYAAAPEGTLVVTPDNNSRQELNGAIRGALRDAGHLGADAYDARVLVAKQNVTGEDRKVAGSYEPGDVVLYRRSKGYATVLSADHEANTITVKHDSGAVATYDPAKRYGVTLYAPEWRAFAVGDRLQLTAPDRKHRLANRATGTVQEIDAQGNARVAFDGGRTVGINLRENPHVDHGYCATSFSSQGKTVDRVLVQIDCGDTRTRPLVGQVLGYVALSRPRHDARVYTDDETKLVAALSRHKENSVALSAQQVRAYRRREGLAA